MSCSDLSMAFHPSSPFTAPPPPRPTPTHLIHQEVLMALLLLQIASQPKHSPLPTGKLLSHLPGP